MHFAELFERYYSWADWILRFFAVGTFCFVWFKKGEIEWHSLLTIVAILGICLVVAVQLSAWQIRKRVAAGIVRFRQEQRPVDTVERLSRLKADYLYVGWSFESMLEPFAEARNRGGMAQKTALRLLLADPEDPQQINHCIQNLSGNLTPEAFRKDLCQRLLKTLAALEGFGQVAIRLHAGPFKRMGAFVRWGGDGIWDDATRYRRPGGPGDGIGTGDGAVDAIRSPQRLGERIVGPGQGDQGCGAMEAKIDEVGKLGPGWEPASWRLRTLTAIWAGGIEKGQCAKEMKSTTLMGSLRYWAEMACRENGEPVCDGDKWCGAGTCPVCGVFGSTEIQRAFRIRITGLKHDDSQGGLWGR